jgi:Membrane protein involved in the export of O-antigen and teichoic acid
LSEYKLFVQRIGLVGVTNILISLSSIILLPILTKNLTIEDYGVWGLFNTTVNFIPLFVNLGLPYTMVRFLAVKRDKGAIQEGFYSITFVLLIVGLVTSVILFLFSKSMSAVLFNGNEIVSVVLAASVLMTILNTSFLSFFRTFQQMKMYSILSLVQSYATVLIASYFVMSGYEIAGAVFGYFVVLFAVSIIAVLFILHQIGFMFPKFKNMREYLSFGVPTVPGNLSSWMVDLSDRYVIGILLGTAFVGYYSPGYTLGTLLTMFGAPFTIILPALLSSYYDQNKIDEVGKHLRYSVKYFLLLSIPAVFGLSILSAPLLNIMTTQAIAQNGYLITPFVALGALMLGIQGIISQVLALEKKTKIIGSRWMAAAVLNLGLNIIFVPRFGIIAAAVATLAAYVFTFITTLYYSQKYIKIDFDFNFILRSLAASVLMTVVIALISPVSFIGILITIGVASVVYIVLLFILGGINRDELKFFKKMVKM